MDYRERERMVEKNNRWPSSKKNPNGSNQCGLLSD